MIYKFPCSLIQQITNTNETMFLHIFRLLASIRSNCLLSFGYCARLSFSIVLSDNLNTEESTKWKALFWVTFGLLVVVLLLGNRSKVWGLITLFRNRTSQPSGGTYELPSAHNNKGSGDAMGEDSQLESEGTNGLRWGDDDVDDGAVMPQEL